MKQNSDKDTLIGRLCWLFLAALTILTIMLIKNCPAPGTILAEDTPDEAVTLVGSAQGRNGPVEVEVVATADRIYGIRVLNHVETDGIGSIAVQQLPGKIYETQSLRRHQGCHCGRPGKGRL